MISKFFNTNKIVHTLCAVLISGGALAQAAGANSWSKSAVIYEVNVRQYSESGSLKAVTKDMGRLKSMGVDLLWYMPLHPIGKLNRKGGMGSYYSVQNYRAIAPEYGSKKDFKEAVEKAHKLGMRVIIDWVANHTAWDHEWISKHPEWYEQDANGKIVTQYDWSDVAKLNYSNKEMREAMIQDMEYWVKEYGIDGFRCDVAFLVPLSFWLEARARLERIKPMYMLAEMEWNADITKTPNDYFIKAFDASYGWNFMGASTDLVKGKKDMQSFKSEIVANYAKFPERMQKLYFLTNHDENSWNGTVDEKYGKNWQQIGAMVYTLPQSLPMVYTGEEVGLNRRLQFFEKDPILKSEWKNKSRIDYYKRMINLHRTVPALASHSEDAKLAFLELKLSEEAQQNVIAYKRKYQKSEAWIFINLAEKELMVEQEGSNFSEILKGYKVESNGKPITHGQHLMLSPNSYTIYYK